MFLAALMSRSWLVPHLGQSHWRMFNGFLPLLYPQVEQTLAGRIPAVDDRKLAPVPLGLVFEHRAELSPTRVEYAPVETGFRRLPVGKVTARMFRIGFRRAPSGQVFDRKVFNDHRLVLADESGRELVEEVASSNPLTLAYALATFRRALR